MTAIHGVIPIDKPVGPTSHDAVAAVRRALKTREGGHRGTLVPFASGLLLICVGKATRLAEYLTAARKRYTATVRLGVATDTDDLTGETIATSDAWSSLSADAIRAAFARQVGAIEQLPPTYSAKKVDGQRMYAIARRGDHRVGLWLAFVHPIDAEAGAEDWHGAGLPGVVNAVAILHPVRLALDRIEFDVDPAAVSGDHATHRQDVARRRR